MKKLAIILTIVLIPLAALSHDSRGSYQQMAWEMYQASRICVENYVTNTAGQYEDLEQCIRAQNTCYGIYNGMSDDKNREWLTHSKSVNDYITGKALEPLDYCHILKLISEEQKKPKEDRETPKE